jgi:hypothetical protein
MHYFRYLAQPADGQYLDLFDDLFDRIPISRFDAGVAYATSSGVNALLPRLSQQAGWANTTPRFMIGIDFCRTDPQALDQLAAVPNATVRIPDGRRLVQRRFCTPYKSFHPKTYIARGNNSIGVISGSGNLSRNGLTAGFEVGSLLLLERPLAPAETDLWDRCQQLANWFDTSWLSSNPLRGLRAAYLTCYSDATEIAMNAPTDDDAFAARSPRRLNEVHLRQLRAARFFWIQAGNLHLNRGPGVPGNQLMMTSLTRVFFERPADDVPTDTHLGFVDVAYLGRNRRPCSLRFSNNSMDVLTLPVPGAGGPPSYDQETLLFERRSRSTDTVYRLKLASGADANSWRAQSRRSNTLFTMTSGRQWGVF